MSRPWITRHRLDGARKSWNDRWKCLLAWLRPAGQISELGLAIPECLFPLTAPIPTR